MQQLHDFTKKKKYAFLKITLLGEKDFPEKENELNLTRKMKKKNILKSIQQFS